MLAENNVSKSIKYFQTIFFSNRQTIRVMFCMEMLVEIISRPYIVFQQTQFVKYFHPFCQVTIIVVTHLPPVLSSNNCSRKSFTTYFVMQQSYFASRYPPFCQVTNIMVTHLPPVLSISLACFEAYSICKIWHRQHR